MCIHCDGMTGTYMGRDPDPKQLKARIASLTQQVEMLKGALERIARGKVDRGHCDWCQDSPDHAAVFGPNGDEPWEDNCPTRIARDTLAALSGKEGEI